MVYFSPIICIKSPDLNIGSIFFYPCSYLYIYEPTVERREGLALAVQLAEKAANPFAAVGEGDSTLGSVSPLDIFKGRPPGMFRGDKTKVGYFSG